MTPLSIVITSHNDSQECAATVNSIRETAGDGPEVIVVDDGSPARLQLKDPLTKLWRVQHRIGVGPARHYGACRASGDWILLTDSHMRFSPGWYQAALEVIQSGTERTLWCCQCIALAPGDMDMSKPHGRYHGAKLLFTGPDEGAPGKWQVLEGKWTPERKDDGYEIESVMGACYLINRDWFFQLGGLRLLREWGSDEPYLSLRTWLCGGECRFTKRVQIGHQFRGPKMAGRRDDTFSYVMNKMLVMLLTMPQPVWTALIKELPKQYLLAGDVAMAHRLIADRRPEIECERAYLETMQRMSWEEYCEKFGVTRFW